MNVRFPRSLFRVRSGLRRLGKRKRRTVLLIEPLESRQLLTGVEVHWIGPTSGFWDVATNWSPARVPVSGDTAVINTAATATITIQSGDNIQVRGITTGSADTLSITGGALMVTGGDSTLVGPLSMTGGSLSASGSGVNLTANTTAAVSEASLYAQNGAKLSLPGLTSDQAAGFASLEATGTNSELDLENLGTFTDTSNGDTVEAAPTAAP